MTGSPSTDRSVVPPWPLAVGAMLSVQLGSALSVPLIEQVGAAGHLSVEVVLTAAGLALLSPVLQYALDLLGIALVVVAGAAAQRGGRRTPPADHAAAHDDQQALHPLALEPK